MSGERRKRVVHEWDHLFKGHPKPVRVRVVLTDDRGPTHAGVWLTAETLDEEEDALGVKTPIWRVADEERDFIAQAVLALCNKIELLDVEVCKLDTSMRARFP